MQECSQIMTAHKFERGRKGKKRKCLSLRIFSELMMEGRLGDLGCWTAGWLGNQHHGTLSTHTHVGEMRCLGCYLLQS